MQAEDSAQDDDDDDDCFCRCPQCRAAYRYPHESLCEHFVTDWCFTNDEPCGYWATDSTGTALKDLLDAVREFQDVAELVAEHQLRINPIFKLFPPHLRCIPREHLGHGDLRTENKSLAGYLQNMWVPANYLRTLLGKRGAGYIGGNDVESMSMVGDSWTVHWAHDGRRCAASVEAIIRDDTAAIRAATAQVRAMIEAAEQEEEHDDDGE